MDAIKDNYPQPFKVGSFVRINPELADRIGEHFRNKKMTVTKIKWIGFGDEHPFSGCESGWIMSTKITRVTNHTAPLVMDGYDSHWFVKYGKEKP